MPHFFQLYLSAQIDSGPDGSDQGLTILVADFSPKVDVPCAACQQKGTQIAGEELACKKFWNFEMDINSSAYESAKTICRLREEFIFHFLEETLENPPQQDDVRLTHWRIYAKFVKTLLDTCASDDFTSGKD